MILLSKSRKFKILGWVIFVLYIAVLLRLTVFRNEFLEHPLFSHGALNPPFSCLADALAEHKYFYFIYLVGGNIVWFVPFGFLLPYLTGRPRKLPMMLLISFLFSFVIEFSQYAFGTGESEVDDLLLNTLGAAAGFLALKWYVRYRDKKSGTEVREMK